MSPGIQPVYWDFIRIKEDESHGESRWDYVPQGKSDIPTNASKKNGFKNKKQARATARNIMRNTFRTTSTYFETT